MDHVSEGQLQVELGTGWKQYEAEAFGYDWPSAPERLGRLEVTIEVSKPLWTGSDVEYDDDFYRLDGADGRPHPTQEPHPPIMGSGEEFTLRITAKHADTWNYWAIWVCYRANSTCSGITVKPTVPTSTPSRSRDSHGV